MEYLKEKEKEGKKGKRKEKEIKKKTVLSFFSKNLFPFISPSFSLKLIHLQLVKSLLKPDTFWYHLASTIYPDGQSKANHHHSNLYPFPSLFFSYLSLVFRPFPSLFMFFTFSIRSSVSSIAKM